MLVLVINSGSSSLKYQVRDVAAGSATGSRSSALCHRTAPQCLVSGSTGPCPAYN